MKQIVLVALIVLTWTIGGCSRPDHLSSEQVQLDAAANRFEVIDKAITEGRSYRLVNISDGLAKVGSKEAPDRLLIIARNRDEAIRNVVLTHSESLAVEQALRVLSVLAESDDGTAFSSDGIFLLPNDLVFRRWPSWFELLFRNMVRPKCQ